jgi:protein involved in polysaccharide export with SLBB domain
MEQPVLFLKHTVLRYAWRLVLLIGLCGSLAGCADGIKSPTPEQLAEFEQAGPGGPVMDLNRMAQARLQTGPYQVVPGDVLQLDLPARLFPEIQGGAATTAQAAAGGKTTQTCRVSSSGTITLPDGHQLVVKGLSLAEVEAAVADTYYPSLVRTRPAVYAQVVEYATESVRIMGAVNKPGIYHVRHDQMSLVGVLMEAGEIVEGGAATIRIIRSDAAGTRLPSPVDGLQSIAATSYSLQRASLVSRADPERPKQPTGGLSVRFRKEGPLPTTGTLTIEDSGVTILSRWLDIANPYQRRAVLRGADDPSGRLPLDQLESRLSRLAQLMDSRDAAPDAGWTPKPAGTFVSYVGGPAGDGVSGDRPTAGGLKKLVYDRSESAGSVNENEITLILPVRGLNIPFADVPLADGDSVIVERIKPQTISVMGLVARPGSFPYPPDTHYTLAEALALAGGLDMVAEPHYVSVYRLRSDGTIVGVTFQFVGRGPEHLTAALALDMKPGDVISVEHTLRTRTNVFFDRIVRITLGWYPSTENW